MKGEVSVPAAVILGGISMVAAAVGGFYSAQLATQDRFTKDEIEIAETKRDVEHLNEQLDRLELKLDALLERQGINPNKYEVLNYTPVTQNP